MEMPPAEESVTKSVTSLKFKDSGVILTRFSPSVRLEHMVHVRCVKLAPTYWWDNGYFIPWSNRDGLVSLDKLLVQRNQESTL